MRVNTLTVLCCIREMLHTTRAIATIRPFARLAPWRIVLEGRVARSALAQTKYTDAASPGSSEN